MNISLIGMMGAGKTTIANLLAERLSGYSFIDTDEEIVKLEKSAVNEIFELKGEKCFRNIESEILNKILENDNQIISTGGGIVTIKENLRVLKEKSCVIYLKADWTVLFKRVKNTNHRPLLNGGDMGEKIRSLLNMRSNLYESAHIIIDTENKIPDMITDEIIEKTRIYGKSRYNN